MLKPKYSFGLKGEVFINLLKIGGFSLQISLQTPGNKNQTPKVTVYDRFWVYNERPLEGALYIILWEISRGPPEILHFCEYYPKLMVLEKEIHRAVRTHKAL